MPNAPLRPTLAFAFALAATGCASKPQGQTSGFSRPDGQRAAQNTRRSGAPEADFTTPVARSALRERALAILSDAARGPDAQMRANALEGLLAAPTRLEPLARLALEDENLAVRYVAAVSIGKAGLTSLAPAIEPLLTDRSMVVRAAAVFALKKLGESPDPSVLAGLLAGSDLRARAQAAYLLGELRNATAIPMLREAARRVPPKAPLVEVQLLRLQIAEALSKLGDQTAIETLRAALYPSRPEDLESTALAVQIIGQVQDRRAVDQLIYLTALEGPERMPAEVRLAAAAALAQLGQPQGAFIAEEHLASPMPALRAQAAFVLGETAQAGSLGRLDELMKDQAEMVRVAAAAAALRAMERETSWPAHGPGQAMAEPSLGRR